ncbi:MAG: hypothetical protein KKE39_12315 [Bacteroidetes bacterium]|nr:hypothetical protein [Bacteroidota bacterium]MBU1374042.1 hypothetical protein [Bacteroidota bacterium]MBU1484618.1 hypothetical protein [Bacteroidota bacterium]MBU1761397.1 hypothetical protein [Bacteroidota bacterium]MBU2269104.1 hypothetical protein [Bacteroidota bacterium]
MMKKEDDYIDWEKEAPHLYAIPKENAFKVPKRYFNELHPHLLSQVTLEDLGKESVFEVPENYFNQLQSQIISQIKIDELINQNNGFKAPENYFKEAQQKIKIAVKTPKKSTKIFNLNFIRYAAAACILLTTSVGIYFNISRQQNVSYQLSKLPNEAIENYLLLHTDANDLPAILNHLDNKSVFSLNKDQLTDDQIKDYLEYTP